MSLEKVTEQTLELSKVFQEALEIGENGTVSEKPLSEAFKSSLPETLPFETLVSAQEFLTTAKNALHHAVGVKGTDYLAEHADENSVVASDIKFGNDRVSVEVLRKVQVRNPKTGETSDKYGATTTRYISHAGTKKSGEYRHINDYLAGYAAGKLGA
ncbi:hypothetical protein ACLPJK_26035 [Pseudomonas aeruginosa]|uniref:hypothetical protein n=1 Tax=Pseudomonas aeruginosa TaxID=287 RepID=UPI003D28CBC2